VKDGHVEWLLAGDEHADKKIEDAGSSEGRHVDRVDGRPIAEAQIDMYTEDP
jgi:hypothetical protein